MKEMYLKLKGITPLMTHNKNAADPFNPYAKIMKPLTAKRNKTDEDLREISRIEWEAALYLNDGMIAIPGENFQKALEEGGKKSKAGKKITEGVEVGDDWFPLSYRGPKIKVDPLCKTIPNPDLDKFFAEYSHTSLVKVPARTGSLVPRTRCIFRDWSCDLLLLIDENVIDERTVFGIVSTVGRYVGICEKRNRRMGRFDVERFK